MGKPRRGLRNPRSRPGKTMTKSRPRHGNSRSGPGYTPTVKYWSWLFPRPGHGKAMTNHGFSPTRFQKNRFFLRRKLFCRKTRTKTLPFQFFHQKTLFKTRTKILKKFEATYCASCDTLRHTAIRCVFFDIKTVLF